MRTGRLAVLLMATSPAAAQWVVNNKRVNICVSAGSSANSHLLGGRSAFYAIFYCCRKGQEILRKTLATEPEDSSQDSGNFIPK